MIFRLKKNLPIMTSCLLIALSVVCVYINPPTSTPDEMAHLAYPRHVLATGELPSFKTAQDTWESHQPPLYYIASIPLILLFDDQPFEKQIIYNRGTSVLFFCLGIYFLLYALRKAFPNLEYIQSSALLLAGLPMLLYIVGSFSNDILLFTVSCAGIALYFYCKQTTFRFSTSILVGLFVGLGILSKIHIYPIVAIVGMFLLWKKQLTYWLFSALTCCIIVGGWVIHNMQTTGDLLGISNTFLLWGSQTTTLAGLTLFFDEITKLFSGFVGVFGKFTIILPTVIYVIFGVFALVLLEEIVRGMKKQIFFTLTLIVTITTILLVVIQNVSFYQPQGRYMLGVIPFFSISVGFLLHAYKLKQKIYIYIFSISCVGVIALQALSARAIIRYYDQHPISSFTLPREINLLDSHWNGDKNLIAKTKTGLQFTAGKTTLFTLQDMRIPTNATVTFNIRTDAQATGTLSWKLVGDHTFAESQSIAFDTTIDTRYILPITKKSLLQDVQLEIDSRNDTIEVELLNLYAE